MKLMACSRLLVFGVICVLASVPGWAQLNGTGLTGTVTDATGGVVADVQVVAVQDATGLRHRLFWPGNL
jgi:hypothetical protein